MPKIIASIRNFRDRIRASVSVKSRNILLFIALFLLVVLAIVVRLTPVLRGPLLIKAFDPWIQYYNADYLSTHSAYEYFHWRDFKSWYPQGYFRSTLRPGLTFTVVAIYKIFDFLGIPVSLYHICYFFPAFMGGITVLVMYFLGKEVHSRGTGLMAAFFLAFNIGYLQRTIAGFFDNETIGVFSVLMLFLFFLKAVRTGKIYHSIISGVFLGYLSLSWGGYQFAYLIIPMICIILILLKKYNEHILIAYAGAQGTGLLVFSLYINFDPGTLFSSLETGGIFLFTIILIIFHLIYTKKNEYPGFYNGLINLIKWGIIPVIIIVAILIWIDPALIPFGFGGRFYALLNPLVREGMSLVASVAEQNPSAWGVFYYNILIPLILVPLGIYFCLKRLNAPDIFMIVFVLLLFYFTGAMIRIILLFAPAASLIGAYGLVNILKIYGGFIGEQKRGVSRKRRRQVKGTVGNTEVLAVYFIVGFLCVAQVVHTVDVSIERLSYSQIAPAGILHDWEEALMWMRNNLPGTAVVVSWWDYGYWLTPIGNVTTVNDNATFKGERIGMTGMAFMQTNEIYSAEVFRELQADYVLVFFGFLYAGLGGDEGKWPWMVRICNDHYEIYKEMGLEKDNWEENAVFNEDKYQNQTTGLMGKSWFESQLVRLMFYGERTDPASTPEGSLVQHYAQQIQRRQTDDGKYWKDYIPDDGLYDFNVFVAEHFSPNHMVKLYKVDYTALESKFAITDPEVFDSGYGTFKLDNIGTKDLLITSVEVNGKEYNFTLGKGINTQKVDAGEDDLVWIDIKSGGTTFNKDDVVRIKVTAESEALQKTFTFSNSTSNFFVKEAGEGAIKINKANSKVIQIDDDTANAHLEVENVGESIIVLDRFYVNDDIATKRFLNENIEYLSGSSILKPGEKAEIYLQDSPVSFYPIGKFNKIGVVTPNDIRDEVLFTSSKENYSITIYNDDRILSPELAASSIESYYRKHIPIDFSKTHAYTYDNGSTIIKIHVKNTGEIPYALGPIYITESWDPVFPKDITLVNDRTNLGVNEEEIIIVDATDYIDNEVNEEILIRVTTSFGETVASDAGYIYTIRNEPDIQVIKDIEGTSVSYIYANETGSLIIKNTGNVPVTLDSVYINETTILNCSNSNEIEFVYGDATLDVQECATISFDIPGLKINKSTEINVRVTTYSTAYDNETFYAKVNSDFYNIEIDGQGTVADIGDNELKIRIENNGYWNVTIDSIYVNETYINLSEFVFEDGSSYEIANRTGYIVISITLNRLEQLLGITPLDDQDTLLILARTIEGAEDSHEEAVRN
ncbi:MAG: STT3 domain-containing protein [Candidatus Hodarchaeota archaeon]